MKPDKFSTFLKQTLDKCLANDDTSSHQTAISGLKSRNGPTVNNSRTPEVQAKGKLGKPGERRSENF